MLKLPRQPPSQTSPPSGGHALARSCSLRETPLSRTPLRANQASWQPSLRGHPGRHIVSATSTSPEPTPAAAPTEPALQASSTSTSTSTSTSSNAFVGDEGGAAAAPRSPAAIYPDSVRNSIQDAWQSLQRWSRMRNRDSQSRSNSVQKIAVLGGGSFGTALASTLAGRDPHVDVVLLMRDEQTCHDINKTHVNTKYLKEYTLPPNVRATLNAEEAMSGVQYVLHAVPCQHSRNFLKGIKHLVPPGLPIICVSKGLELGTGDTMAKIISSVLGPKQPTCFLSGPSFAKEVMEKRPTGLVAASKDPKLCKKVQELMAGGFLRVNSSNDVVGVEICGALKNVLAIAAGIVEGMDLGRNAQAAVIVQGCAEIRWLAESMGASPTTISGLSGLGDIMLTCYGDLSRNRTVGLRLGRGESLADILASSSQVAEGVATAGVVVTVARNYRVQLPVLTAVAQVLGNELGPKEAVEEIMQLPQVAER